ncbi:putative Peptidase C48; SUMO/Sentrin/Ubl1 [Paratrimastix pyriformis]|uniref:Peptidase C48 n=1 Tax=Paratrimastix pyriformis TaxID=342808 RepID=A0ABQ8UNN3_9EUKA|nr:putative Peptidase C48; SUMO/Sentrin/Ubl1 [Paratrimastix pyriformis]
MSCLFSLGDADIFLEDVVSVRPGKWLTDSVITFWFEWLKANGNAGKPLPPRVSLVSPATLFFVLHFEDQTEIAASLAPLHLTTSSLIMLPVNNSTSLMTPGAGSHWSLLFFEREGSAGSFWHLDSSGQANVDVAQRLAAKIAPFLGLSACPAVHPMACAQQRNGFDCGVFVCAWAEWLAARYGQALALVAAGQEEARAWLPERALLEVTQADVAHLRIRMGQVIAALGAARQQRAPRTPTSG